MAVRVASAAGLRNAATCEFLHDRDGRSWFLEVNTRLQVEHGITELVTGLDLVREQLWLAAGAPLSAEALAAAERAAAPNGHAIEVRLSAEDPARSFAPTPGAGRALDDAGRTRRPGRYGHRGGGAGAARLRPADRQDHGPRGRPSAAIDRLRRALDETEVGGIQTTLPFHRHVVRDPSFLAAELSTGWVDDHWDGPKRSSPGGPTGAPGGGLAVGGGVGIGRLATRRPAGPVAADRDGQRPDSPWHLAGLADAVDRWPAG